MIQNDRKDFTFRIKKASREGYKVVSDCKYPQLEDANDLKNRIMANHLAVEALENEFDRYREFVKKYEGTFASMNKDSNFAENKKVYEVLLSIIARKKDTLQTITQESST